jgi:hypothetical protein
MGDDQNRYFQRKSQIFELDPASAAAYVVDAANPAAALKLPREQDRLPQFVIWSF